MTSNVFLYLTVLCYFHSTQGLFELPLDITAATEVLGRVTGQIAARNDSTLQEFTEIFNYFVNLTQLENESREEVNRQITSNLTQGDDGDAAWQTAINDVLEEEKPTGFNRTLYVEVVEYIGTVVKEPENLRLTYLQSLHASRKDDDADINSEEGDMNTEFNPFWDTPTRRIFNGKRTKIKHFPFIASVHIFNTFQCAGSIIKSDLVITAASCLQLAHNNRFFRENPSFLSVRVGSHFFSVGGDVVSVLEVYFHPTYEPKMLHDNLAIMRLSRLLNFKRRKVKKIDFDRSASSLPENTPGIVIVGWGSRSKSNKIQAGRRLHAAELDFYDTPSCKKLYGKTFVTRTNFCAGYLTKGDGACNRDVGDPGLSGKWLVGVTSFGSASCGVADTPTVFTKLGYYVDWIEEIMELKVPRMSRSTTMPPNSYLFNRPIKSYGIKENGPIDLLRQLQDLNSEPDQDVNTGPGDDDEPDRHALRLHSDEGPIAAQNVEIYPNIEVDPDMHDINKEPEPENIRIHPPTLIETGNVVDYSQSGESSEERPPMEPAEHTTSLVDFEPSQQDIDVDVESVARTLKPLEVDYKMDSESKFDLDDHSDDAEHPDVADSSKKPVTSMGNVDPEETMSSFNREMDVSTTDNSATTSMTKNQDVWVDNEDYTAKRKIHHLLPEESRGEVTNLPNQIENQTEQITNSVSANTDANDKSIEFGDDPKKLEDIDRNILDEHQDPVENDEDIHTDQPPFEVHEKITDDMVKREIQKLIAQLGLSNEIANPVTEDSGLANDTPLRNLVKNGATDKTKSSETVLTFLYLTDSEKQRRAALDMRENENLSIDPAPFQRSMQNMPMQRNDLAGKSEIYHIFAKVFDTVVNKTTE